MRQGLDEEGIDDVGVRGTGTARGDSFGRTRAWRCTLLTSDGHDEEMRVVDYSESLSARTGQEHRSRRTDYEA
jgi:hypothetical protein